MTLIQLLLYALGFVALLVIAQDIYIFPGAFLSKAKFWRRHRRPPPHIESIFIKAKDGTELELWRYPSEQVTKLSENVAIIFHGNGGPMENFLFVQMWLSEMGITSYNFDYRGYGRSGGWPSEAGIVLDSDAAWEYILNRERIESKKIIIIGLSVGSAPAARIAALHNPKLLLLASAFKDLPSAVRAQPLVGLLASFVRHKFPTVDYVRDLKDTHLVLAHSLHDKIVPHQHSIDLEAEYGGSGRVVRYVSDESGHNMALYALKKELAEVMWAWL